MPEIAASPPRSKGAGQQRDRDHERDLPGDAGDLAEQIAEYAVGGTPAGSRSRPG
jgi:hypothetical protein